MPDVLAIVSKAVFEASSKSAAVGQVLPLDRYVSGNKALEPLRAGGRLVLVTVRPPDERLWLVAVLESPTHDGTAWVSRPNTRAIADVTALRGRIRFTSDTGISATKGALGMSLQTPRQLTADDVAMLLGAAPAAAPREAEPAPKPVASKAASRPPPPSPPAPPPPSAKGAPTALVKLLEKQQWSKALEALLSWWSTERAPGLAELIERVSAQLPRPSSWRLSPAEAASFDLVAQLSTLTDEKFSDSLTRIRQLEKVGPDPRVARALAALLVTPPFTAQSSREFWTVLFELLTGPHADPRTLEVLAPVAKDYQATFGRTKMGESMERRVQALVTALSERFATVPSVEVKPLLAALPATKPATAPTTKSGQSLEALLAAVYERPDDDGVREVYADALLEAQDPRGEFMVLQLKRARGEALTPAETKAEAALQKKHAKAWLGPLYDVLYTTHLEFRRGFLYAAQIRPVSKALPAARNHPAWSTVRELNMSTGGTNERGTSLILQPNARHLRVLTNVVYLVLDELAASPGEGRELEVLDVSWLPLKGNDQRYGLVARRAWAATLSGQAFPKLRVLRLGREAVNEPDDVADLWTSPLAKRLERVQLWASSHRAEALFALAASRCTKQLTVELDFGAVRCGARPGGRLEVRAFETRRPADDLWKALIPTLDPALWTSLAVAPGPLTDPHLASLRKRLPDAQLVAL